MNILRDRFGAWIHTGLLLAGLLVLSGLAQAQAAGTRVTPCSAATPNNALCLTYTAVTTGVNGEILTGVTYRVEQKFGLGAYVTVAPALSTLQYFAQNLAPGTYFFRVYVNCTNAGCIESAVSNIGSKDATANPVQPTAPVITIAVLISPDAPPTVITVNGSQVFANAKP